MATDHYVGTYRTDRSPFTRLVAITPSDTTLLDPVPRAIFVGTSGSLIVDTLGGDTSVTLTVTAGNVYHVRATIVHAASTAGGLVAAS